MKDINLDQKLGVIAIIIWGSNVNRNEQWKRYNNTNTLTNIYLNYTLLFIHTTMSSS